MNQANFLDQMENAIENGVKVGALVDHKGRMGEIVSFKVMKELTWAVRFWDTWENEDAAMGLFKTSEINVVTEW